MFGRKNRNRENGEDPFLDPEEGYESPEYGEDDPEGESPGDYLPEEYGSGGGSRRRFFPVSENDPEQEGEYAEDDDPEAEPEEEDLPEQHSIFRAEYRRSGCCW